MAVNPNVISITPSAAGPTNATALTETVTFSEMVSGVTADDFSLRYTNGDQVTGAVVGMPVSPDGGLTYSVPVTGLTGDGTVQLVLNSSGTGITDGAGNAIQSGFTGSSTTLDHTAPTIGLLRLYDGANADLPIDASTGGASVINAAARAGDLFISAVSTGAETNVSPPLRGNITLVADTGPHAGQTVLSLTPTVTALPSNPVGDGVFTVAARASSANGLALAALPDGLYTINADVRDQAGNSAPEVSRQVLIDTTADAGTPATLTLNDTADHVINAAEARAVSFTVAGLDSDATAVATFADATHQTSVTVAADGTGTIDLTGFNGAVTSSLAITDTHQNAASVNGNTVQLDSAAPATPTVALRQDTGASSTDHLTNNASLTVAVQESGASLSYAVDGHAATTTYTPSQLSQGDHTVAVFQTDAAGNASASGTIHFTLDSLAPNTSLSGVSGQTNLVDSHVLSGTLDAADAGLTVTLRDGSTVLGSVHSDAQGHFTLNFTDTQPGAVHTYTLTASATDAAGNTGTSQALAYTLNYLPNQASFGEVSHDTSTAAGQIYALYEGLLGRDPDIGGLQNWAAALNAGTSLHDVTQEILSSPEALARLNASDNAGYVEQLYETVLGRHSDPAGSQSWISALDAGTSRADVVDSFVFSAEHVHQLQPSLGTTGVFLPDTTAADVARLYYGLLGRAPDASGLQNWTSAAHSGMALSAIAQSFMGSNEYVSTHAGQTDQQFVDGLYQSALGRGADASGERDWLYALSHGGSRADVAVGIIESSEAQQHLSGLIENGFHLA